MGHTVDYSKLPADQAEAAALEDLKFYLGEDKFAQLHKDLVALQAAHNYPEEKFMQVLWLLPVSGYPIKAWYKAVCRDAAL